MTNVALSDAYLLEGLKKILSDDEYVGNRQGALLSARERHMNYIKESEAERQTCRKHSDDYTAEQREQKGRGGQINMAC